MTSTFHLSGVLMDKRLCTLSLLFLPTFALMSNAPATTVNEGSRKAFFKTLQRYCGTTFEGTTQFPQDPEHPMVGKRLVAHVLKCGEEEIRIPFYVGTDSSRTWIITLSDSGLLLKHDHRHPDGTPDSLTMYGGWASESGTPYRQYFAADAYTADLLPAAATNVWMLEIDEEKGELVYALERHGEPRYRAVFRRKE
jgi:hypothetical protein